MFIKLSLNGAENQNNVLEHETQYCPLGAMEKNKTLKTTKKGKSADTNDTTRSSHTFSKTMKHGKVDGILY